MPVWFSGNPIRQLAQGRTAHVSPARCCACFLFPLLRKHFLIKQEREQKNWIKENKKSKKKKKNEILTSKEKNKTSALVGAYALPKKYSDTASSCRRSISSTVLSVSVSKLCRWFRIQCLGPDFAQWIFKLMVSLKLIPIEDCEASLSNG